MRPRTRRKLLRWGFISIAGVIAFLIILSFSLSSFPAGFGGIGGGGPGAQVGDHWHPTLSMVICGEDITLPQSGGGIHSHGDGRLLHAHPQHAGESGRNANLGRFFDSFPMVLETDRIQAPGGELYENGQACPNGQPSTVQVIVNGQDITETLVKVNGEEIAQSFRGFLPEDGDRVEVFFR